MGAPVTFVIPNRDDATKPPTLYERYYANAVPREGESVYLGHDDSERQTVWRVKNVRHVFQTEERNDPAHLIEVRLIEPNHWTLQ